MLLILIEKLGYWDGGAGEHMISSVLERMSLNKWCDVHTHMSISKLVMYKEMEGVS